MGRDDLDRLAYSTSRQIQRFSFTLMMKKKCLDVYNVKVIVTCLEAVSNWSFDAVVMGMKETIFCALLVID